MEQLQQEGRTCWWAWCPSPALHKTSSLLISGVTWCRFSPCQGSVSCLRGDLLASRSCSLSQGELGSRAARQDSWLRLLTEGGMAPCPPATHLSWGSRISPLLSHVPASLPGISALYAAEEAPAAAARAGLWEAAGNPNIHGNFPGWQGLLWTEWQGKSGTALIIRKPVKFSHSVGFSQSACMQIICFTSLMTVLLLLFFSASWHYYLKLIETEN